MNKPNSLICNKCVVVNNILRCALCKNKTEDWMKKNLSSRAVTMTGNHDLYQPKLESEETDI